MKTCPACKYRFMESESGCMRCGWFPSFAPPAVSTTERQIACLKARIRDIAKTYATKNIEEFEFAIDEAMDYVGHLDKHSR